MDFLYFQVHAAVVGNYKPSRLNGNGNTKEQIIEAAMNEIKGSGQLTLGSFETKSGDSIYFKLDGNLLIEDETK